MPALVFFPFLTMFFLTCLGAYFVGVAGLIISAGKVSTADDYVAAVAKAEPSLANSTLFQNFETFENTRATNAMLVYHFLGLIWTAEFLQGMGVLAMAGAVAMWYFDSASGTKDPRSNISGSSRLWLFFRHAWRYHVGTVAFGSFIITVIQIIRLVLAYITRKTAKLQQQYRLVCAGLGARGRCGAHVILHPIVSLAQVKCLMCCCNCCLWCLKKCVDFINQTAYIFVRASESRGALVGSNR